MNYSNIAAETTLAGTINAAVTSLIVASATGYPAAPFAISVGNAPSEVMLVTAVAGTIFTVTRGYDGTTARTHASGTPVIHAMIAADLAGRPFGSGTAGRAAFWSAVDTLSSYATSLYWDAVNSRLGIGTETPTAAVAVDTSNRLSSPTSGTAQLYNTTIDAFVLGATSHVHAFTLAYTPPTAPTVQRITAALRATATAGSAFSYPLLMRGMSATAIFSGTGTLTGITTAHYGQVQNGSTGTLTTGYGVSGFVQNASTGTFSTGSALRALQPGGTASGSFGDTHGLYIETQVPSAGTQSGTHNGIYQAGTTDSNTFNGPTTFGSTVAGIPRTLVLGVTSGAATVANDVGSNIALDVAMTLQSVALYAKTPPVGSALTVDIKRSTDGGSTYTTIFSTLPTIAAAAHVGGSAAVFSVTSVSAGDVFRVDVTGVGSGTAGSSLTVQLNGITR